LVLPSANLHFVVWVEPISDYVGFRFTQPNLHFVSSIVQCETQQWPILEPSPKPETISSRQYQKQDFTNRRQNPVFSSTSLLTFAHVTGYPLTEKLLS
jgi:hypothetical protein